MSKRFGPPRLKGSTQEKSPLEIFRFGYRKAVNDKKAPDRVGSEQHRCGCAAAASSNLNRI
jgi:hypothetical protein